MRCDAFPSCEASSPSPAPVAELAEHGLVRSLRHRHLTRRRQLSDERHLVLPTHILHIANVPLPILVMLPLAILRDSKETQAVLLRS